MFKVTILNHYCNKIIFIFDDKKGNVTGYTTYAPFINKDFFLTHTVVEIIKEKTGLVIDSKNIEFEFNKGEEAFDNFISKDIKSALLNKNKVKFINYEYKLDNVMSKNSIHDNYDILAVFEDDNKAKFTIGLDSSFVPKGTKPDEFKTSLSILIQIAEDYGTLIIDNNVLSSTNYE